MARTNWKDLPSEETPITAENLNNIENGIQDNETKIKTLENTLDNLYKALGVDTNTYDNTKTYSVGDMVVYNHIIYQCTTAVSTAEDFDESKWTFKPILDWTNIDELNKL